MALAPNGTTPAACDGDTASDGYHVFSYLVPQGTSPTSESFANGFPSIDYGLVTDTGQYYGKANTGIGTGQVLSPPNNLQFAELLHKGVTLDTLLYSGGNTSGIWEAGIACANTSGAVTDYWNVEVTFTASGTDPNGFTWTAPAVPAAPNAPTGTSANTSATVNWVAPTDVGSSPITGYVLTPYIGSTAQTAIDLGNVTSDVVTGLTNGTAYTFTVAAINAVGTILTSPPSASITPATVPGAPTIGTATGGNIQASVAFTPPSSNGGATISKYTVTATDSTTPANGGETATGTVSPIVVPGLTNGDSYTFTVTATNVAGTGAASGASNAVVPAPTVPGAPTIGTATGGNTQASVAFTAPGSNGGLTISHYTVTATDSTTPANGNQVVTGSGSPIVVTGLTNGDSYTFTVTATNSDGTGAASGASNAVVPATVPDAPTIGTATGGNAQASVAFTPPANDGGASILQYTVTATDSTTPANGNQVVSGSGSPIVVTGLTNGDSYTFTVTATNSAGTGAASGASNAVVPATVPDAPTIGTATGGDAQASVTFTPPADDGGSSILHYTVTATDSTTPANGNQVVSGSGSPIVVTGLTNGDSYTFTVTATNTNGTGEVSAPSNAVVPATVPDGPTIGTATGGNTQASVAFTPPANDGGASILHYTVTATDSTTPANGGETVSGSGSPIVVTSLTNGDSYTFTVTATNSAGTGAASGASNAVVPATVPGAPTIGTATAGKGTVKLTWTAPSSNGGAAITHYLITPSSGSPVTVGDVTSDTITGLTNGTAYSFTVAAVNSVGTGAHSAASKAATPDGLYITTKTLPKGTKGKKYTTVKLAEKYGVGTEKWTATGLPKGLTLSSAGSLSGTLSSSDAVKTYSVTITVKDSSKPTKQTASTKFSLVVLK
ncbi:MAG: fibronectin type III domain-containing protein [Acidimicrobiales bacterium]